MCVSPLQTLVWTYLAIESALLLAPAAMSQDPVDQALLRGLVQSRLVGSDRCSSCMLTQLRESPGGSRVAAIVESQREYALFMYKHPPSSDATPDDLSFDQAVPLDADFSFNLLAVSKKDTVLPVSKKDTVLMKITAGSNAFQLEFKTEQGIAFVSKLKSAVQAQTNVQSASHVWLQKYTHPAPSDVDNPFLTDVFQPTVAQLGVSNAAGWPFNQILQKQVGNNCPVVNEAGMSLSASFSDLSRDTGNSGSSALDEMESSMKRSYEKSLDDLDGNSVSVSGPGGVNAAQGVPLREHMIRMVMMERESEYTELKNYRIFCGTWNVNGQPAAESLGEWLQVDEEPPDIYAVGFQELDLSKNAYIFAESPKEEEWFKRVRESLHRKAKYKKVKLVRLVGMMLIVFVREELATHKILKEVSAESVGTGILNMMGNKGGVGVRFGFHDTTVCFVNSHFAAHVEEYERRNQDFRDINSRMNFMAADSLMSITDHDIVFWIGDLNYRLSDVDNETCKERIANKQFTDLMKHDQLHRQMTLKKVFLDYIEGNVTFIPTYKYDTGTDDWDTSEKCRAPAWCDRILWRGANISQLKYRSHPRLKLSDHKPVSAIFNVDIKIINQAQYRKVQESVTKQLDRLENDYLPQVDLDVREVVFSSVKFMERQSKTVTVTNAGQVPVQFLFINKLNDDVYCKPWLNVEPCRGSVKVGGTYQIQLEVDVSCDTAHQLNAGMDSIEDILVLHLQGGKDLFITVSGNYIASSFGSSIEALVNMFGFIREVETATLIELENAGSSSPTASQERPLDVPKEIWRLVDHIYRHGMQQEGLFQQMGLHREIQMIRDSLDTGTPYTIPGSIHSVSDALLLFLNSLAEPVIPHSHYERCLNAHSNFTLSKQVVQQVRVSHRNVFKYLCAFLRKLLQHSSTNNLDAKHLATVFGALLLKPPALPAPASSSSSRPGGHAQARAAGLSSSSSSSGKRPKAWEEERKRASFVYHFLVNDYDE